MDELRACPGCGSNNIGFIEYGLVQPVCEVCGFHADDIGKWNTRASDEVIRGLVEALHNLTARASYFGYGFTLGHEMDEAKQALAQARKHPVEK